MDLHLYNYNNYYNRKIKPVGSSIVPLTDYEVFAEYDINFNPNDGVTTEHIIGGLRQYTGSADYAVVAQGDVPLWCWFVIENQRVRGGQYKLVLKRDSVGENLSTVLKAPCFVEKGWVPGTDPAIFNKENMTFNQIKTTEKLLKDKTQMPWLVGYYSKGSVLKANLPEKADMKADISVSGISNWEYYKYKDTPGRLLTNYGCSLYLKPKGLDATKKSVQIFIDNIGETNQATTWASVIDNTSGTNYQYTMKLNEDETAPSPTTLAALGNLIKINSASLLAASVPSIASKYPEHNIIESSYDFGLIEELAGKVIYDSKTSKYYRIHVNVTTGQFTGEIGVFPSIISNFGYLMYNIYSQLDGVTGSKPTAAGSGYDFMVNTKDYKEVSLVLEDIYYSKIDISISPSTKGETRNAPYNIFTMPYGEFIVENVQEGTSVYTTMNSDLTMRLVSELIHNHGGESGELYDVQLLPYCPIDAIRSGLENAGSKTIFKLSNLDNYAFQPITGEGGKVVGFCFNVPISGTTFNIDFSYGVSNIKVSNETEFCRLVSPNWNGSFEFSPAKNYGINGFTVDYELKPFQPYIHLAPIWNANGLYKSKNGDPIGLICGGDFGLTMINDAWEAYERQNKNYQNIFDRQIQNLEVTQKYQRISDIAGAVTGAAGAATTGAMTGMFAGGGVGAGIGAGAGALLSGIGGIADVQINDKLRAEAMDYTKDQFGYQMGNIRALPDSLTKVNSFNPNNHIFPILEFYSCTEAEKAALENKIIYNGMSIGRVGQLKDYRDPLATYTYVKGQIIELDIDEDTHFVNDIANEIYKGVRI